MKRTALVAGAVLAAGLMLWLAVISPSSAPPRSISFTIGPLSSSNDFPRVFSVVASNASASPVLYSFLGGLKKPWFEVAYRTNVIWLDKRGSTLGGGNDVMWPHEVRQGTVEIPEGAISFRIGLFITSLTWRGQTAWRVGLSSYQRLLRPIAGFLMPEDTRHRSKTEWSEEYPLIGTNSVRSGSANRHDQ